MNVIHSFAPAAHAFADRSEPNQPAKNSGYRNAGPISELATLGLGRVKFFYETTDDSTPSLVIFANGSRLVRMPYSQNWVFMSSSGEMPWNGHIFVDDKQAVFEAGAAIDILRLDGAQIRYLGDKIVMLITMCGDVFEFEYSGDKIKEVKLDGKAFIQLRNSKWHLVGSKNEIHGVPKVSEHGFLFDAEQEFGYSINYQPNGNLTTMHNGKHKFVFGAARFGS